MDDKLKLEQNFNVRGALGASSIPTTFFIFQSSSLTPDLRGPAAERITYKATLENIIPSKPGGVGGGGGVQAKLDALAQLPDFAAIAEEEAGERGLDLDDILRSAQDLYHAVSKHAHGNDGIILVRTHEYSPEECAALVAYLRLQDGWSCPLAWEETREKVGPLKAAGTVGAMDTEGEE